MSEPSEILTAPTGSAAPPRWDRHFWLALVAATLILLPRSALIMRAQNECMDSDFHLRHGLAILLGTRSQIIMGSNDPPLGQMILAVPMIATGSIPSRPIHHEHWPAGVSLPGGRQAGDPTPTTQRAEYERTIRNGVLYGNAWSPGALLVLLAVWKAALFVPAMLVIFQWSRAVYGVGAAWITQALLLVDPTLAAHIPMPALDTLAVEAIVIACFCMWRYFQRESTGRLLLVALTSAAAILIKHTAVITPGVFLLMAFYYWVWRPWRTGTTFPKWREKLNVLARAALMGCVALWALLLFDISRPSDQTVGAVRPRHPSAFREVLDAALERPWPAGTYIGCVSAGFQTNSGGQRSLLFGHITRHGLWYYFPAVATFKVPLGIAGVLILAALAALLDRRMRPGEISILIPLLAWLIFLMMARMNTGFRHFLPAYVFILMWAGGAVARLGRFGMAVAWVCIAAAFAHVLSFHPDYLSYVNFPRHQVWMQITDSNLDWNQSMRQIRPWIDRHPDLANDKRIYVAPRLGQASYVGHYWLADNRVTFLDRGKPPPQGGILIISPVWVCGVYDDPGENQYEFLQRKTPIDVIGHSQLVYDLDAP